MTDEILKYEGRLYRENLRAKELNNRISGEYGLVAALRDILDPTVPALELRVDVAMSKMGELANAWAELKEVTETIALIKKTMGR